MSEAAVHLYIAPETSILKTLAVLKDCSQLKGAPLAASNPEAQGRVIFFSQVILQNFSIIELLGDEGPLGLSDMKKLKSRDITDANEWVAKLVLKSGSEPCGIYYYYSKL